MNTGHDKFNKGDRKCWGGHCKKQSLLTEASRENFMDIFIEAHKKGWPFDGDDGKATSDWKSSDSKDIWLGECGMILGHS